MNKEMIHLIFVVVCCIFIVLDLDNRVKRPSRLARAEWRGEKSFSFLPSSIHRALRSRFRMDLHQTLQQMREILALSLRGCFIFGREVKAK